MGTYGVILPGATRLARLPADPSPEAARRKKVVDWCLAHAGAIRLTARHFGHSPDTVSRWVHLFQAKGVTGLEPRSRRPHQVRQPQTPPEVVARLVALREQYPRWGREKLRVQLAAEGITLSAKTIDRTLSRLRKRGVLREPPRARKRTKSGVPPQLRRPADLAPEEPGALVQVDTKYVTLPNGVTVFEFGAIDWCTRKRVVGLSRENTSAASSAFLEQAVARFPFPIKALQNDGGPEYERHFITTAQRLGITRYVNRPYYPQGNGRIERSFKTDEEEFYQVDELPTDFAAAEAALLAWNQVYETIRPHQALGYLTPDAYYQHWRTLHPDWKEDVSDMS